MYLTGPELAVHAIDDAAMTVDERFIRNTRRGHSQACLLQQGARHFLRREILEWIENEFKLHEPSKWACRQLRKQFSTVARSGNEMSSP